VYDPKGEYQIVCEHLEPHGLGALQLAFDQLKRRLQAEGLFDVARKRPLPALPRKIGIVTSLDGAAIRDIVKVLGRRYPNVHLVIRPARVQGDGAAEEVARGLADVVKVPGIDVVIVGRGGGSVEDLWAFNEEVVARATSEPGRILGKVPGLGTLAIGAPADLAIFDLVDGPVEFGDTRNNRRAGTRQLVPVLTVKGGRPYGRPPLPTPFLY